MVACLLVGNDPDQGISRQRDATDFIMVSRSSLQAYLTRARSAEVDVLRLDEILIFLYETSSIYLWHLDGLLDDIATILSCRNDSVFVSHGIVCYK